MTTYTKNGIQFTRVNNDSNGNPRYVVHFLSLLSPEEQSDLSLSDAYVYALKKSRVFGGRKFHNRQYGGGIAFQSYNLDEHAKIIASLRAGSL